MTMHALSIRAITTLPFVLLVSLPLLLAACDNGRSPNHPPVVTDVRDTVAENASKTLTLRGTDADGDALRYTMVTPPAHGVARFTGNQVTYTPAANYQGTDSFTYRANDGKADSGVATVRFTVTPVNAAPTANPVSATVAEDVSTAITLLGADSDGDSLTYTIIQPANGSVSILNNVATYTSSLNYNGADSFTYRVNDGTVDSADATVNVTVTPVNDAPRADAGADQSVNAGVSVTLSGSNSTDVDSTPLSYSWTQTGGAPAVTLNSANTTSPTFTAPNLNTTANTTLTLTLTVTDSDGASSTDTVDVVVNPVRLLNDTGITECGDYAFDNAGHISSNSEDCNDTADDENDPIPRGQDGHVGRDFTDNDDTDGYAGFSFTKISSTGMALAANAAEWNCVKDNVTGLIWEVKTDDGGLQDKDNAYVWYEPDNAKNGGFAGYQRPTDADPTVNDTICSGYRDGDHSSYCNTQVYVTRVNAAGWCGASDWRLPTVDELSGIATLDGRIGSNIDSVFFPNTPAGGFWSSSPLAFNAGGAWVVDFNSGNATGRNKRDALQVRLVRSGQ